MIRNSELWGGLFWLALGAFVFWAGRDMGLGRLNEPGSGFAFFWIGILMCGLAASVIGQAFLSGGPAVASLWAGTRWGKVLVVIGAAPGLRRGLRADRLHSLHAGAAAGPHVVRRSRAMVAGDRGCGGSPASACGRL